MTKVLALGGGTPGLGTIDGEDDFSFQELNTLPVAQTWYSPVDEAAYFFSLDAANVIAAAGNFTVGDKFESTRQLVCTGVRFFWKSVGSAKVVKCRLYGSGVSAANVDVNVNASGVYTGTFAAPVTLAAYKDYAATVYETTGTNFPRVLADGTGPAGAVPIIGMIPTGPFTIARSFQRNGAGDTVPINTSATSFYPVEPIFDAFPLNG